MKKTFFILIIVLVLAGAALAIYYFRGDKTYPEEQKENQEAFIVKDDFSILLPEGWIETASPQGVSAMAINAEEEITDPEVEKINFRTYYSVTYDTLQGRTMESYAEYVKDSLGQVLVNVDFIKEEAVELDGRDTYTIEMEIQQQGIDFKVSMFLIKGEGDDLWLVSFNTVQNNWDQYQDLFREIAASFETKQNQI
jgi:hypothetical protein